MRGWAYWYAAVHVILCLICAVMVRRVGAPRWRVMRHELPLGMSFSLSTFLLQLRFNLDILVLAATATPHFIGIYGVARRIVGVGLVIPGTFDRQVYGRLAVAGAIGPKSTLRLAKKYLVYSVFLSGVTSVFIFIIVGAVPWLIGPDYVETIGVTRILCWTLISTAIQFIAFDALNAAELHRLSTVVSGAANFAGAAMVIWLGSAYGVTGIFVALYLSDLTRGAALWFALELMSRSQPTRISLTPDGSG